MTGRQVGSSDGRTVSKCVLNTHSKHSMVDWFHNVDDEKVMPESIMCKMNELNRMKGYEFRWLHCICVTSKSIRTEMNAVNPIDLDSL